jgi:hypothetical protein
MLEEGEKRECDNDIGSCVIIMWWLEATGIFAVSRRRIICFSVCIIRITLFFFYFFLFFIFG